MRRDALVGCHARARDTSRLLGGDADFGQASAHFGGREDELACCAVGGGGWEMAEDEVADGEGVDFGGGGGYEAAEVETGG